MASNDYTTFLLNNLLELSPHKVMSYVFFILFPPMAVHLYRKIRSDYNAFLSLGPGGTPSTPSGYVRICLLRLIARSDVFSAPEPLSDPFAFEPYFGSEKSIPKRQRQRPKVAGIAPQRQMTQKGTYDDVEALMDAMRRLEKNNIGLLMTGKSCFEKHSLALFLARAGYEVPLDMNHTTGSQKTCDALSAYDSTEKLNVPGNMNATCGTPPEVAHLHGTDGSVHLTLHPSDAKVIIEKGWGERHPLAGRGNFVPKGFVMVYAPKGKEEIEVVVEIMRAGCWWVSGIELAP